VSNKPLAILHLEDEPADVELVRASFEAEGVPCEMRTVSDRAAFSQALEQGGIDLVLSDYSLPQFDGLSALRLCRQRLPDVPFILLSGTMGEEAAIQCLQSGATDYVLKHRLSRLVPAVRRALVESEERRRRSDAERCLRDSEERFRKVFEEAQVGMMTFGPDLLVLNANEALARMLRRPKESLVGTDSAQLLDDEEREAWSSESQRLMRAEVGSFRMEKRYAAHGGGTVWGDVTVSTIDHGAGGAPVGLAVVQDITERKSLEEQLRHSQKMEAIGRLAGGVAHDFNNLLSVISGYGEMLGRDESLRDPHRLRVEQILRAAERAASLTRQLLAFSRKQVIEPKILDLNALLTDADQFLRRLIGEDVEIVTALATELGAIKADRGQIEQVVMNLVVNARDAMPEGGRITLETGDIWLDGSDPLLDGAMPPGGYVMLSVSDTGVGMSPEVKARIFEPFFTTKGLGKGTGLGLATVYGIARQSGGHICVVSEPGSGATFRVFFPRVEGALPAASVTETAAQKDGDETILVVEDEEAVRELVAETLEGYGYRVLTACDLESAMDAATSYRDTIHLLVSDVILPGKGGSEVAREISALRPDIRVLYVSGYTDDAVVRHGVLEAGVAFLQKPFSLTALGQKVRQVLDERKAGAAPRVRRSTRERAQRVQDAVPDA
jgi:PAS domain S-box-containing protein